jgi:hypothetical protein
MRTFLAIATASLLFSSFAAPAGAQVNGAGQKPYLGWSTFSEQTINGSFLTQANIQTLGPAPHPGWKWHGGRATPSVLSKIQLKDPLLSYSNGETMHKRIALIAAFTFSLVILAACQGRRPSHSASASCDFGGGKTIKTVYSSPRMNGRKYMARSCPLVRFGALGQTKPRLSVPQLTS